MAAPVIQNVSDTAFMIAAHRATESSRPDALFHDPFAARLAGQHGTDVVRSLPAMSRMTGWAVAIRTCIIDAFIHQAIAQGADAVLNLGAGLDTRPYRLDLPAALQWIEVDYTKLIELKERQLATETPRCKLQRIGLDLTNRASRRALFADVQREARDVLVITEGVIPYLTVDEAGQLADDLRVCAAFRAWIVDYFSPRVLKFRARSLRNGMQNAPWRFRPDDYDRFFASHGWTRRETKYLAIEAQRLNRPPPLPALLRLWIKLSYGLAPAGRREALRKTAGYVLFGPLG